MTPGLFSGAFLSELFRRGGPVMYPLLLCSIASLAILVERVINLRRNRLLPPALLGSLPGLIRDGKFQDALALCRRWASPLATLAWAALGARGKGRERMREALETEGRHQAAALERHLPWLATIASVAPLLGLLGTITGVIRVFTVVSQEGPGDPHALAGGIAEALIATASGLVVAIPAFVFYTYLTRRVDRAVMELERHALLVAELLADRQRGPEAAELGIQT